MNIFSIVGMLFSIIGGIITSIVNKKDQDKKIAEAVQKEVEKVMNNK